MIGKIEHSKNIIGEAVDTYKKIALACSFGKDSMVVLHLAQQIKPDIPVFTIMTPFKPKETLKYKDRMSRLWKLNIKEYLQKDNIEAEGRKLWKTDPNNCCDYFKVMPTKDAVKNLDAWITGLRRTEGGEMRKFTEEVEVKPDGLVKINPILNWTETDIWRYMAINRIPPNPLYKKGYRSLGCEPCNSLPKSDTEPERAGRWRGANKIECGIHCAQRLRG